MATTSSSIARVRRLRGYAFDPSLSLQLDTVDVNDIVFHVEWENLVQAYKDGPYIPTGEYLEIIDYDPSTKVYYPPVDLNNVSLLLQDGLTPDVNNPQFHQQMVYAVAMITIKNFEKALGRKIQWSDRHYWRQNQGSDKAMKNEGNSNARKNYESEFVAHLRVYPHALRQPNAYYHPDKKALLFGYFPASPSSPMLQMPGMTVFTCLSHDVIAHETTHAILDGLHRRYIDPTHPDVRAFHEAFADIVALFQHFTFPEVLRHQIAKTGGNLQSQNLLGQLAHEFGKAVGGYGSLRDAIGHYDKEKKEWVPHEGRPEEYAKVLGFHARGAILVAAIFEAFLNCYKKRVRPYLRLATGGTGVLPAGELHPDLVHELSEKAASTARHILHICVRALDYCPPLDITFGDYLRAMVTADRDMVPEDELDYRIALIEAFQKRGIFPKGLKSMSVESLCHATNPKIGAPELEKVFVDFLREFKNKISYETDRETIYKVTREYITGSETARMGLHQRINVKFLRPESIERFSRITGLLFPPTPQDCERLGIAASGGMACYKIENLWLANRVTPDGKIINRVVVSIMQQRGVVAELDQENRFKVTGFYVPNQNSTPPGGFVFRGGCTLIFDLDAFCLRYAIRKSMDDKARMEQQFRYQQDLQTGEETGLGYFDDEAMSALSGPFGFMHSFHQH